MCSQESSIMYHWLCRKRPCNKGFSHPKDEIFSLQFISNEASDKYEKKEVFWRLGAKGELK